MVELMGCDQLIAGSRTSDFVLVRRVGERPYATTVTESFCRTLEAQAEIMAGSRAIRHRLFQARLPEARATA